MCYRDKTFCSFWRDCDNAGSCGRAMTDDVVSGAERTGLPIARYMEKPSCHSDFESSRSA